MRMIAALILTLILTPHQASPALAQAAPAAEALPYETVTLPGSGVRLYAAQDGRLPRVWYNMAFEAGERFVPADRAGMAALAAEVLDRGPASIPYDEYRQTLFRLGAEISWEAGNRFLTAHVKARPEHLARAIALVYRTAAEPRLDDQTFAQLQARLVNQRRAMDDDMQALTIHYGKQKLWEFRPEARQPEGWAESIQAIKQPELFGFIRTRLSAPAALVTASGPMPAARLAESLGPALAGWAKPFAPAPAAAPVVPGKRRVVLIDKPGATDNQIYMLSPYSGALTSREAAAAEVFLAGMGAGLGARLGKALRVERGLTYHAGSGLRRVEWPSWYVYSFGGVKQTPQIVSGVFELFDKARTGLSADEVAQAKDLLLKAETSAMETPPEQMEAVAAAVAQGLPADYPFRRPALLRAVTLEQVNAQAAALSGLDRAMLIVMGDAAQMKAPLEKSLPAGTEVVVRSFEDISAEARGSK